MKSICKTQCRNLTIGNRYGSFPKHFIRTSARMILIRGIWIYFHIVKVIEVKGKLKTSEKSCYMNSSEVLCVLVSIFLVKINLDLDKGFGFA